MTEQLEQLSLGIEAPPPSHPPAVDQAARDDIANILDQTLFVEAGAGSGKTTALVNRVESLVISGIDLDSIAAITFTEKAAAELRNRIRAQFLKVAADPARKTESRDRARRAAEQVDGAAIGTLHAFAQRLLAEHPVEAGLPPGVEVVDEIGSQIAFDDRWRGFVDDLFEDESIGRSFLILASQKVNIQHLRDLATIFGSNWDLVSERVALNPNPPAEFDPSAIAAELTRITALRRHCTNEDDKMLPELDKLDAFAQAIHDAHDEIEALELVSNLKAKSHLGTKPNWSIPVSEVKDAVKEVQAEAKRLVAEIVDQALQQIAGRIATFTIDAAEQRRREGRLEFHDLLVRARQLLRHPDNGFAVREVLRERYLRLLLDEFQDTDPIQVDLAVLLASPSADVDDRSWNQIETDPGRLFFVGDPKQSIYRFRRADIGVFLGARDHFGENRRTLVQNFRSVGPIIEWVNHVFGTLIQHEPGSQPDYEPLTALRASPPVGPPVTILGAEAQSKDEAGNAEQRRRTEAADVAATITTALHEQWSVRDEDNDDAWRPARPSDICILIPARTSLAVLERELLALNIPFRAETSSLVYATREVRDLLIALQAVSDPTNDLFTVSALRSPLYGCGDDDLAHWRTVVGGRFDHTAPRPVGHEHHPVAVGLEHLHQLHEARLWSTPSELLDRLIRECGVLEVATATNRPRDIWRRVRFVVDQARAWVDAGGSDLRAYLRWATMQGAENARVSETVLPETDDDSVRILTIHAAKGLEFPITIMSGMTTRLARRSIGVDVAFPDNDYIIKLSSTVKSTIYDQWQPIDEQIDLHERLRLLYVAATRASDHLVVSLHRIDADKDTAATVLAKAALDGEYPAVHEAFEPVGTALADHSFSESVTRPPRSDWMAQRDAMLAAIRHRSVVAATTLARNAAESSDPGLAKRTRDLELPPWNRGRYGTAVGRAVHGVLQTVDLRDPGELASIATAQATAEGVSRQIDVVTDLAAAALTTDVAAAAVQARYWRELWVAAPLGPQLIEGYIDLLYEGPNGLVVVDWKTDHVDDEAKLDARLDRYRLQGAAYAVAVEAAVHRPVERVVFVFLQRDRAIERDLPDLAGAMAQVRDHAEQLAQDSGEYPDTDY